jgi:subtilase family serine protease
VAATGSFGSPGTYPAYSPNVLAVGGTSLFFNPNGTVSGETGWGNGSNSPTLGGSGGGISSFETTPVYQMGVQTTGARTIPDVSFLADPATGVAVIDSYDFGATNPWVQAGGTGLAAAAWAGMIAIADQGEGQLGKPPLDGPSQTLPDLYNISASKPADFNDITSGSNGQFTAGPGYDEVTGIGTPVANLLIPDLVGLNATGVMTITSTNGPLNATEGQDTGPFTLATFTDPNTSDTPSDITATVAWGDGTSTVYNGVANIIPTDTTGDFALLASHAFADEGDFATTFQIRDTLGAEGRGAITISPNDADVTDVPVTVSASLNAGLTNATVAQFTDANPLGSPSDFTANVSFTLSDGSTVSASSVSITEVSSTATLVTYDVLASLTVPYTAEGIFPVSAQIVDDGGSGVLANNNVDVGAAPLLAVPVTVPAIEGQGLSNVLVAEFTDTNTSNVVSDYTATETFTLSDGSQVAGSTAGLVTVSTSSSGNTYAVFANLSTPYAEEGTLTVATFVLATNGSTGTIISPVQVADAPLIGISTTVQATEGQAVGNATVAEFTDTDPNGVLSDYSAQVNFNLGNGSNATVTGQILPVSGTTFKVVASSGAPYSSFGNLPITVVVNDAGGASVTINSTANVALGPISVTGTTIQETAGAAFTAAIGVFFHNSGSSSGSNSLQIHWGDGAVTGGTVQMVSPGVFNLIGSHTYGAAGTYTIGFTVTAADGAVISGNSTALVSGPSSGGGGGGGGGLPSVSAPPSTSNGLTLFLGNAGASTNPVTNYYTLLYEELLLYILVTYFGY